MPMTYDLAARPRTTVEKCELKVKYDLSPGPIHQTGNAVLNAQLPECDAASQLFQPAASNSTHSRIEESKDSLLYKSRLRTYGWSEEYKTIDCR